MTYSVLFFNPTKPQNSLHRRISRPTAHPETGNWLPGVMGLCISSIFKFSGHAGETLGSFSSIKLRHQDMDGPREGTSLVARAWQPTSCLENPMDKGAQQTIVHRVTKIRKCLKRLSTHTFQDLEKGVLSEVSQTEKEKYCMTLLICGI